MKTIFTLTLAFFTLIATNSFAQADLIKELMKSADVTEKQAKGGAGALFEMAQEKLSKEDFVKVADAVPGMDDLLDAVPDVGGNTNVLGSIATTLTGLPKVQAAFEKLGIGQDKVAVFMPIIVNYVEEKGGEAVGKLLDKAFK